VDEQPLNMAFGLVTYMWGADWNLETLLRACREAGVPGVELRTTHAHGVEPSLSAARRAEVRRQFEAAQITLVGIGSNERFDSPDADTLARAVAAAKRFIELSHDVGGSGVKVKPDRFHPNVPHRDTIRQIGHALRELGEFGEGFGQQIRLEVHGQCAQPATIEAIMKVADHDNVRICWNSNRQDLQPPGLTANFQRLRRWFGSTLHVRELDSTAYPFQKLLDLLRASHYEGWVLLEGTHFPKPTPERIAALRAQRERFDQMVARRSGQIKPR